MMVTTMMTRADLIGLLDAYGAELDRWPEQQRVAAMALLAVDADARRLHAEANALDRVLDRAPRIVASRETELADRIMAAAARTPRVAASNASPVVAPATPRVPTLPRRDLWRAAGMMAACLVLGFSIGWSDLAQRFAPAVEALTSSRIDIADSGDHWDEDIL